MSMNFDTETTERLLTVGDGIGYVNKTRMLFDENGTNYLNETYIDFLRLIPLGCDDYCYFKLFEENSINKPFKIELESICAKEGTCEEFGESYDCCLEYRAETDSEVLLKAEKESKRILKDIVDVTLERENRVSTGRFEEVEIEI